MIQARFFIGDSPIEYNFDENNINLAINELSMMYYEKMNVLPLAIFISLDLYRSIMLTMRYTPTSDFKVGINNMQYRVSNGVVMVKPVVEPKERFIYAGNQQGYENALIDKRFEEIVFGVEE